MVRTTSTRHPRPVHRHAFASGGPGGQVDGPDTASCGSHCGRGTPRHGQGPPPGQPLRTGGSWRPPMLRHTAASNHDWSAQGSDAYLKRQFKHIAAGELGYMPRPSTLSGPFRRTGSAPSKPHARCRWMAGTGQMRKRPGRTLGPDDSWRACTRCSGPPC